MFRSRPCHHARAKATHTSATHVRPAGRRSFGIGMKEIGFFTRFGRLCEASLDRRRRGRGRGRPLFADRIDDDRVDGGGAV